MNQPSYNLAWLAKHHFGKVRVTSFVLCVGPAMWLAGEWLTDSLGVNSLNRLLHFTGRWALIMLAITLSVTPARRLSMWISRTAHARYGKRVSDWNWLIKLQRQLGLFTFFYAVLHLAVYVAFDAGFEYKAVRDDVIERPFILVGFAAFLLLIPLAATSNQASMRRLGRTWRQLHKLIFAVAALGSVHFWLQEKAGDFRALPYVVTLALLSALRIRAWLLGDRRAADEVKER